MMQWWGAHCRQAWHPHCYWLLSLKGNVLGNVLHALALQVACGSGLALIYEFLLTDEPGNRPGIKAQQPKVRGRCAKGRGREMGHMRGAAAHACAPAPFCTLEMCMHSLHFLS